MDRLKGWLKQLRALVRKEAVARELDEELSFHIEMETEKNERAGMSPEEARRAALLAFGGTERYKEEVREARWVGLLEDLAADLRYGTRGLRKRPGFAAAAVLTLALGIGGTTAVFSVVRAVLLEPLPYEQSEQLVRLYQFDEDDPSADLYVSGVHFKEYRELASFFQAVASVYTYDETGADLIVGDRPQRVRVLRVSPGYFRVLRARPIRGRVFAADEEHGEPLVVLSERLWRRLGDEEVGVGASVELDGRPHTVIGVMPAELNDPLVGPGDVWVPEDLYTDGAQYPGNHYLSMIARLAPGVTPERARREMAALDRALAEKYPDVADDGGFKLVPLHADLVSTARPTLLLLLGAVGLVLLIACVNVANLQMVRALSRGRDLAVRCAIGAWHGRIARQILTESLLLAGIGGAVGVGLAIIGVDALLALGRDAVPRAEAVGADAGVLAFAAALTLATGVAFGLVPALRISRVAPATSLRDAAHGSSSGRRYSRLRSVLVAGQVALALVLLVGASALAMSVYRLSQVDLGIRTDDILTFELNLPAARYDAEARTEFHRRTLERLARLPGVSAAAAASWPPATGRAYVWGTRALTGPLAGEEIRVPGEQRIVAGDYFRALEIPLLEGRFFDDRDGPETPPVAVVSETVARRLFPDAPALGGRIRMGGVERDIIGVVPDVAVDAEGRPAPHVYHSYEQYATRNWTMTYLLAAAGEPRALLPAVRRVVAEGDPRLVVHEPATLDAVIGRDRSQRSFAFLVTALFAGLALALAMVGLYGVLAYVVGQRTREIGIRLALGARRPQVAGIVLRQALVVTAIGLAFGLAGALGVQRVLDALVFQTEPSDPAILGAAVAALALSAAVAALFPAARAARVTPRVTLAEE